MNIIKNGLKNIAIPALSIVIAFLIGAVFIILSGHDPINAYQFLFNGSIYSSNNPTIIESTLAEMTPLVFTGLAVAIGFKSGLFNIGVEGQYIVGTFVAAIVGSIPGLPAVIHLPLTILAGALGGALWASISGFLKARFGINEVINCIMLNYIAYHFCNYLIKNVFNEPGRDYTRLIKDSAKLALLDSQNNLNAGIYIAIAAVIVVYILMSRTVTGYEIKAVGLSPSSAEYGGISIQKNIILTMAISGALAGMAGAIYTCGVAYRGNSMIGFANYGFDGMAVALIGKSNPIGVALSAFLFAALHVGSSSMQFVGIPKEIGGLIQGTVLILITAENVFKYAGKKFKKKTTVHIGKEE
jgi:ABC-type uncharacterized transport system permease subunit